MPVLHRDLISGNIAAPMGACPDENVLAQLAHGGIASPALLTQLQTHLDGCTPCRQLVAAVAGGSAPLAPSAGVHLLRPGDTLGRYRVERLIGSGGMGVLYVAHDTRLERRVALKLMHPAQDDEVGKARLWREAQAMARLSHPNVVNVFDLGEFEGQLFLAMELVEGGTLRDWLRARHGWKECLATLAAAGEGLAAAHRAGVVHRDFKPENVLIGTDGRARVTDFGLSRPGEPRAESPNALATGPIDLTRTGTMMGTPAYMSPEQLLRQPADARSDQYSFCVTAFEALYGRRPYDGATLDQVRAQVLKGVLVKPQLRDVAMPDNVWATLARGLSVEPGHRFSSMEQLLSALSPKAARRWPARVGVGFAVLVAFGLGAALLDPKLPAPAPAAAAEASAAGPVVVRPVVDADGSVETVDNALKFQPGMQQTMQVPGLTRLATYDLGIVGVRVMGKDVVVLSPKREGKTMLLAWTQGGSRISYSLEVAERPDGLAVVKRVPVENVAVEEVVSQLPPDGTDVVLAVDARRLYQVEAVTSVRISEPTVAEVRREGQLLELHALAPGATEVVISTGAIHRNLTIRVQDPKDGREAELVLHRGEQRLLKIPDVQRLALGDPAVAEVRVTGPGEVLLSAVNLGTTNLLAWTKDARRIEYPVRVAVGEPASSLGAEISIQLGSQRVITAPRVTRIAVGDAAIADVKTLGNNEILITGAGVGKTTLLLWKENGQRVSYLLSVHQTNK